ncbi:hypothetical protein ACWDUN_04235 [Mycobacterium sp. NPDC003323]
MAVVTDPNGVQWSVYRRWWPFGNVVDLAFDGLIGILLAAPFFLLWPFWLLAKGLGVRWRIVVERDGTEVQTEFVRGWRRSGARIDELALQVSGGWRSGHFAI